jgi:hypothetical protein
MTGLRPALQMSFAYIVVALCFFELLDVLRRKLSPIDRQREFGDFAAKFDWALTILIVDWRAGGCQRCEEREIRRMLCPLFFSPSI